MGNDFSFVPSLLTIPPMQHKSIHGLYRGFIAAGVSGVPLTMALFDQQAYVCLVSFICSCTVCVCVCVRLSATLVTTQSRVWICESTPPRGHF